MIASDDREMVFVRRFLRRTARFQAQPVSALTIPMICTALKGPLVTRAAPTTILRVARGATSSAAVRMTSIARSTDEKWPAAITASPHPM
jgi:hypothetical protein